MKGSMDRRIIWELLAELGTRSVAIASVELTLVGGAAGILTGLLEADA